jgi:hypothetical protein
MSMKKITEEQIRNILSAIYQTNIPAQTFDSIKSLFEKLPIDKQEKTDA